MISAVHFSSDMFPETRSYPEASPDERYTPRVHFEPLSRRFRFTLDVCATYESRKCQRFFTMAVDGLAQSWEDERAFCNPPFSDIPAWIEKAWASRAKLVCMVLPNNRQEQPWWQRLVEPWRDKQRGRPMLPGSALRLRTEYPAGRWRFGFPGNPEGVGVGSPEFGVVLLVWRGN